jgi:hypothetical protein
MSNRFLHREVVPEIIDDFNWKGKELDQNLEEIEWINKYLGGTHTSAYPVLSYIQKNLGKDIMVAEMIQQACKGVKKIGLTGVDANPNILGFAQTHFKDDPIHWVQADIMTEPEKIPTAHIYMLNLFLHHFHTNEIEKILGHLLQKNPELIVVNDLHRSRMAYALFTLLCKIKTTSPVTFHDGRLSILKGFNRKEMVNMVENMNGYSYQLHWKWAFRWQLLIHKTNKTG